MLIYFVLIVFWAVLYTLTREMGNRNEKGNWRVLFVLGAFISLLVVTGLKHYSVGTDTLQYLYKYNYEYKDFSKDILLNSEWGYELFNIFLAQINVSNQGFIFVVALIVSLSLSLFYFKFSENIFLSFYLHLTIGLFAMSMSGFRQMLAVCLILLAFNYLLKERIFKFFALVFVAYIFHNSAIVFVFAYFLRNIRITQRRGIILLIVTSSTVFYREIFLPFLSLFMPDRYIDRYDLLSEAYPVNPMLIIISIAIPAACLLFWKKINALEEKERKVFSILFMLSILNVFLNIMSLNSNMIGRLSFYFIPFITLLIPNVISKIDNKEIRMLALYMAIALPLIQFSMSTPGGTYQIDNYSFFWD